MKLLYKKIFFFRNVRLKLMIKYVKNITNFVPRNSYLPFYFSKAVKSGLVTKKQ